MKSREKPLSKSEIAKAKLLVNHSSYVGLLTFKKNKVSEGVTPKDKRFTKYVRQLLNRGHDDTESWNLDSSLAKFMIPRLKLLKENHLGFPHDLKTDSAWCEVLNKIIWMFEEHLKGNDWLFDKFEKEKHLHPEWHNHMDEMPEWKEYSQLLTRQASELVTRYFYLIHLAG